MNARASLYDWQGFALTLINALLSASGRIAVTLAVFPDLARRSPVDCRIVGLVAGAGDESVIAQDRLVAIGTAGLYAWLGG